MQKHKNTKTQNLENAKTYFEWRLDFLTQTIKFLQNERRELIAKQRRKK